MTDPKASGTHTQVAVDKIVRKTEIAAQAAVDAPKESWKAGLQRWAGSGVIFATAYFCAVKPLGPWYVSLILGAIGFYVFSPRKTNDAITWAFAKVKDLLGLVAGLVAAKRGDVPIPPTAPPPNDQ